MPEKSVREMGALERRHHSLEARVFHASLLGSIILGLVSLLIGLGLYSYALAGQYVGESFGLASSMSLIVNEVIDTNRLSNQVMTTYHNLSEEERANPDSDEYLAHFEGVKNIENYEYLLSVLRAFKDKSSVFDLYLGVYDKETSALVYLADPEENAEYSCPVGYWEKVEMKEIDKFLNWDGNGKLYDISKTDKYGWMCTSGVPLKNASGETVCFILADVTMDGLIYGMRMFALQYSLAIFVVMIIFAILLVRHMKKTIVNPINSIAEAAQNYVGDKRTKGDATNHFSSLNIRTGDEIENLSLVMADMERDIAVYVDNLMAVTAEKERIGAELNVATQIQADMLPRIFPAFPDRTEFDLFASMTPAKEVGGDFYDFFLIDDNHLALVMADVSGKGVPAALFMVIAKTLIKNQAQLGEYSPAKVLQRVNEQLCENNEAELFVTVWLAIIEIDTGKGLSANAGHEHPALRRANGKYELIEYRHSPAVAAFEGISFREREFILNPGDSLFVYTDGVAEATNANGELYGNERLINTLNSSPDAEPREVFENVKRSIDDFVGDAPQFDDITMLCLHYKGPDKKEDNKEE